MLDQNKQLTHYEQSFFKHSESIERELKEDFRKILIDGNNIDENGVQKLYENLMQWLKNAPSSTMFRINTLSTSCDDLIKQLKSSNENSVNYDFLTFPEVPELLIVNNNCCNKEEIILQQNEAIVDAICGSAVLRGAHVFAPGIMGLNSGAKIGDLISVFADTTGSCRKGYLKKFEGQKKFLGNGILLQDRSSIFLEGGSGTGIAIKMTETVSRVPQLSEDDVFKGSGLLQNFPSIVCSRILDPQPGEVILDMCAAPGNKTTHISALMQNQGTLIALEKVKTKIERLKVHCDDFGCTNVRVFCCDSTKAVGESLEVRNVENGPPFLRESFDRILLDGPCSVLGKRPQIFNKISDKELRSFVSLQRKLFSAAVELLKIGGTLVYSTCTITVGENEGIVAWALKTFPCLQLTPAKSKYDSLGLKQFPITPGYEIHNLSPENASKVLRFGPESDSVGFFIASFKKT